MCVKAIGKEGIRLYQQHDFYVYMEQLYQSWQAQQDRISQLEQLIAQLSQDLMTIKKEKPIYIEKIEYHFDQLKVEKLEGTLNIGFSPSTVGDQVEELSVNGKELSDLDTNEATGGISEGTPSEPTKMEPVRKIKMRIDHYFNQEFSNDLYNICARNQVPIDPDFYPMILEEIRKQVEPRIQHYLKSIKVDARTIDNNSVEERIFAQTKQDIRVAIENFIRGLPHKKDGAI